MTENKKNTVSNFLRKNLLLFSALFLSVILMFVFKTNNVNPLLDGKSAFLSKFELIDFQPLFGGNALTNEEAFNFLMLGQIPVDEKNDRVLKIQERSPSVYSYNIRTADYKKELGSYAGFLAYLHVNEKENKKINDILSDCRKELSENILEGSEKELAISPQLISIRQKYLIKLFAYLSEIRPSLTNEIFPAGYFEEKPLEKISVTQSNPEKFVVLTPDTVVIAEIKKETGKVSEKETDGKINVTVNNDRETAVNLVLCDSDDGQDNFAIEWFKILPTHSKIVFNESGITIGEDSLANYLKLATDIMRKMEITVNVDSGGQSFSVRTGNGNNGFLFNSAEGISELEKVFGSDFDFSNVSNFTDLNELSLLIDSLTENFEKADSAKWVRNMNTLFKKFEIEFSDSGKTKKEK